MAFSRRLGSAFAIAAALIAGGACGGEEAEVEAARPSWCLPGPPSLEVGTGTSAFIPIEPGSALSIVSGPQGGTHLSISGKTRGLGPAALVEYGANDASSGELLTWKGLKQVVPLKEGEHGGEVHGLTCFLSDPNPASNAGRSAILWLTVTDDCNPSMRDETLVTLVHEAP